jgi:ubiquitin-small subunit ribosomal protein S27Ae
MSQKEVKPIKDEKPKADEKKKGEKKGGKKINTYYEISGDKITRKLKKCPRCGSFMAQHKGKGQQTRWACGNCSYTEFQGLEKAAK